MQVDASPLDVDSQIMYRTIYLKYMTFNLNIHTCIAMHFWASSSFFGIIPKLCFRFGNDGFAPLIWGAEQLCQACADTGREDPHWRERELSNLLGGNFLSSYGLAPIDSQV